MLESATTSRAGGMRMAPERGRSHLCWWTLILKVAKEDLGKIIGLLINYLKNWLIPSSLD
jgi:hypothetical protein